MAAHDIANGLGHWTERLRAVPAPLPELPDHPTPLELARAYLALAFAHQEQQPVIVEALQELHGVSMGNRATLEHVLELIARLEHLLALPPMRPQMPSTHEAAKAVSSDVAKSYEAELRNPSTPPVPSPQTIDEMVEKRVAVELARVKAIEEQKRIEADAANWQRLERERKQAEVDRLAALAKADEERKTALAKAEEDRVATLKAEIQARNELEQLNAKERVKFRWAVRIGAFTTGAGMVAYLVEHFVR